MKKSFQWKVLEHEQLETPEPDGPHYDEFVLNSEPFDSVEEAEIALEDYFKKFKSYYEIDCDTDFVLLTVYNSK